MAGRCDECLWPSHLVAREVFDPLKGDRCFLSRQESRQQELQPSKQEMEVITGGGRSRVRWRRSVAAILASFISRSTYAVGIAKVALHELATNAAKYGALSIATGRIGLEWTRPGDRLSIRWTEQGGPPANPPTRQGFGTRVMEALITLDIGGELRWHWSEVGLMCEIELELHAV